MRKYKLITFIVVVITVHCVAGRMYEVANANDDKSSIVSTNDGTEGKRGNVVARTLAAPFRAFGKLFGGSRNKNKIRRISKKDEKRFESAGLVRVDDSRSPVSQETGRQGTAGEHLNQGRSFLEAGQINEAIAELSLATSLDPQLKQAHSLLAVAYERKGLRNRARQSHEQALSHARDDAQALNNSGYSLYISGDYKGAVKLLKRAAQLSPNDQRILNNLALAQCRLGKYDDAFKSFAQAGGEFTGRLNTAAMLERGGRDGEAIKHYEVARLLQPTSSTVLRRLAELYQRTGKSEEAAAARRALTSPSGVANTAANGGN